MAKKIGKKPQESRKESIQYDLKCVKIWQSSQ